MNTYQRRFQLCQPSNAHRLAMEPVCSVLRGCVVIEPPRVGCPGALHEAKPLGHFTARSLASFTDYPPFVHGLLVYLHLRHGNELIAMRRLGGSELLLQIEQLLFAFVYVLCCGWLDGHPKATPEKKGLPLEFHNQPSICRV